MRIVGILFIIVISLSGCITYESLLNFSETNKGAIVPQKIENFGPIKVQANDLLQINLSSTEATSLRPFIVSGRDREGTGGASDLFLVSNDGFIEFPTIGKVQVAGMEVEAIQETVLSSLRPYFTTDPIIQVRLLNFTVSVSGEVNSPGSFVTNSPRISVFDAIVTAGDFTDYSRRDSIMIIREIDGERTFGFVDFNSIDVFTSPYFYLKQNDIVYIQPSKPKVNTIRDPATKALPYITAVVSITALVLSVIRTIN